MTANRFELEWSNSNLYRDDDDKVIKDLERNKLAENSTEGH